MTIGVVGKKVGMTRIFTEDGAAVPVSVVEVLPNRITQIKTLESDGYQSDTGHNRFTPCEPRHQADGRPLCESRCRSRSRSVGIQGRWRRSG